MGDHLVDNGWPSYWQVRLSNSLVTFDHQTTPAVVSSRGCVR